MRRTQKGCGEKFSPRFPAGLQAGGLTACIKNMNLKINIRGLIVAFVVVILFYGTAHVFVASQGKAIVIEQIENIAKKKVTIGYLSLLPVLRFEVKNINIEGLLKADAVYVSPSIIGIITGNIILNKIKIVRPEFTYIRLPAPEPIPAAKPEEALASADMPIAPAEAQVKEQGIIFPGVAVKRFSIKDGKVNFIDRTLSKEGLAITIERVNFNLTNLYLLPRSVITNFELNGSIPWQHDGKEEGKIEAQGWINLFKKDIQATLSMQNIDAISLYPYYSNWVDLEKARIEKAKLIFTSNIQGTNNDVVARCHLELTDIVRRPLQEGEQSEKAARIADAVLGMFRALNEGRVVLDFPITMKLDRPEFGFEDIRTAFEERLAKARSGKAFKAQDVLALPTNILQGTVKGATDLTKAVIDGTASVGKELKDSVEEIFKKKEKQ